MWHGKLPRLLPLDEEIRFFTTGFVSGWSSLIFDNMSPRVADQPSHGLNSSPENVSSFSSIDMGNSETKVICPHYYLLVTLSPPHWPVQYNIHERNQQWKLLFGVFLKAFVFYIPSSILQHRQFTFTHCTIKIILGAYSNLHVIQYKFHIRFCYNIKIVFWLSIST